MLCQQLAHVIGQVTASIGLKIIVESIFGHVKLGYEGPGLDHIFIQLGPALPTPPLFVLLARTYLKTFPQWDPMWQHRVT